MLSTGHGRSWSEVSLERKREGEREKYISIVTATTIKRKKGREREGGREGREEQRERRKRGREEQMNGKRWEGKDNCHIPSDQLHGS